MSTVFHNILRAADKRYARRFAVLGAVFLAVLLGSLLLGRYALSPGQLLHMLWTKVTGGAADWPLSDDKVVFAVRLPRVAAAALVGAALAGVRRGVSGDVPQPHGVAGHSGGLRRRRLRRGGGHPAGGGLFRHFRRRLLLRSAGRGGGVAGEPPVQNKPDGGPDFSGHDDLVPVFGGDILCKAGGGYPAAAARHHLLADGVPVLHQGHRMCCFCPFR